MEYPTTIYIPINDNGTLSADRWEQTYEDTYTNQSNGSMAVYEELMDCLGQFGPCYVIGLISRWTGDVYAELIPEMAHSDADDIMYQGDFSECWKYAEGYNTID